MENLIEKVNYRNESIEVYYDTDPMSPDQWGNKDNFLVYDHRDFCIEVPGYDPAEILEVFQKSKMYNAYHIFPVYAYIHSGVALSLYRSEYPFTCPWDTSFKGFTLIKREKGTWKREQAEKAAKSLIEEWNLYLSGQVYGYTSIAGSCWGFLGDDGMKEMLSEAKAEIDSYIAHKKHEWFNTLKKWIKGKRPIEYRTAAPEICFI